MMPVCVPPAPAIFNVNCDPAAPVPTLALIKILLMDCNVRECVLLQLKVLATVIFPEPVPVPPAVVAITTSLLTSALVKSVVLTVEVFELLSAV